MKKSYDKLLLALAFLVLLAGAGLYALNSGKTEVTSSASNAQPADNPYQSIPIPESVTVDPSWPEPGPQSSGPLWIYDVFTPPKIYINKEGDFDPIPPRGFIEKPPFGIYLAEISRKPYRLQIQGFSGNRQKPEECVLFLFDEERQIRFFLKPGQTNAESQVEVLDFNIEREIDEDNTVRVTEEATILDQRTNETIKLVNRQVLYNPEVSIILRSKQDPEIEVEFSIIELPEGGKTFETTLGKYLLLEINLEEE
ncbi:MAG: hypothetical protein ACPGSB_08155 [Opitutales bacterium]